MPTFADKLKELIETKEKFRHLSRKGFDVINTHRKLAITIPEDVEEIEQDCLPDEPEDDDGRWDAYV